MKFKGKVLFIILIIGLIDTVLYAQNEPDKTTDIDINKTMVTEQSMNTASSPYRNLKAEEVINTMYPDPLAEGFMGKKDSALEADRNRSVSDMLNEFESQAKVINDATEVPDEIKDNHTKEDRERIEARAEMLLKEKALNDSADNKGEKRTKENTYDNIETLYSENVASDSNSLASDSEILETLKDINSAEIKEWPSTSEDPEFSDSGNVKASDDTEIIMIDDGTKPLPDEIPDYSKLSGVISNDSKVELDNKKSIKEAKKVEQSSESKEPKKLSKRDRLRKKMAIPLEPVLLTQGKPKSIDEESGKTFSYSGILIPEKQPVARGKTMIRWTLQLDDGNRIPLKSNLKLLQEVKKQDNLDDYITITGKMRKSALEGELRYFIPEKITKGKTGLQGELVDNKKGNESKALKIDKNEKASPKNNEKPETQSQEVIGIATDTISLAENVATESAEIKYALATDSVDLLGSKSAEITSSNE